MALEHNLINLERVCSKAWRTYAKQDELANLSFNEYDYIKTIEGYTNGIRITDLADEMEVTKPSASNMVAKLEKKGFVQRIACEQDARTKRVVLTEKVKADMSLELVVYKEVAEQLQDNLSEEESKQLQALLNKALAEK